MAYSRKKYEDDKNEEEKDEWRPWSDLLEILRKVVFSLRIEEISFVYSNSVTKDLLVWVDPCRCEGIENRRQWDCVDCAWIDIWIKHGRLYVRVRHNQSLCSILHAHCKKSKRKQNGLSSSKEHCYVRNTQHERILIVGIEDRPFIDVDKVLNSLWFSPVWITQIALLIDASLQLPNHPESKPFNWQEHEVEYCRRNNNWTYIFVPIRIEVWINTF